MTFADELLTYFPPPEDQSLWLRTAYCMTLLVVREQRDRLNWREVYDAAGGRACGYHWPKLLAACVNAYRWDLLRKLVTREISESAARASLGKRFDVGNGVKYVRTTKRPYKRRRSKVLVG